MVLTKLAAVFVMGIAIGVLYRIPRRLLVPSSLAGGVAWLVYYVATLHGINMILANFLASLVVGVTAETLARLYKKPATVFAVPGFIPLVPGRDAYTTMLYMVKGDYLQGVATGMQTLLVAGAIAFGILLSATIYRLIANYCVEGGRPHARNS